MIKGTVRLEDSYCHLDATYQATESELEIRDYDVDITYVTLTIVGNGMTNINLSQYQRDAIIDILKNDLLDEALRDINQQLDIQKEFKELGDAGL